MRVKTKRKKVSHTKLSRYIKLSLAWQAACLGLGPALLLPSVAQSIPSDRASTTILPTDVVPLAGAEERTSFGENFQLRLMQRLPSRFYFSGVVETTLRYETNPFQFPTKRKLISQLPAPPIMRQLDWIQQQRINNIIGLTGNDDQVLRVLPNVSGGWTLTPHRRLFMNYFMIRDMLYHNSVLNTVIHSVGGGFQQDWPVGSKGNLQLELQFRELLQLHQLPVFDFLPGLTFSYILNPRTVLFANALGQFRGRKPFQMPTREIDPFYTWGGLYQKNGWTFTATTTFVQNFREPFRGNATQPRNNYVMICDFEVGRRILKQVPGLQAFLRAEPIFNGHSHSAPGLSGVDFRLFWGLRFAAAKQALTATLEQIRQQLEEQELPPGAPAKPGSSPAKPSAGLMPYQLTAGSPQPIHGFLAQNGIETASLDSNGQPFIPDSPIQEPKIEIASASEGSEGSFGTNDSGNKSPIEIGTENRSAYANLNANETLSGSLNENVDKNPSSRLDSTPNSLASQLIESEVTEAEKSSQSSVQPVKRELELAMGVPGMRPPILPQPKAQAIFSPTVPVISGSENKTRNSLLPNRPFSKLGAESNPTAKPIGSLGNGVNTNANPTPPSAMVKAPPTVAAHKPTTINQQEQKVPKPLTFANSNANYTKVNLEPLISNQSQENSSIAKTGETIKPVPLAQSPTDSSIAQIEAVQPRRPNLNTEELNLAPKVKVAVLGKSNNEIIIEHPISLTPKMDNQLSKVQTKSVTVAAIPAPRTADLTRHAVRTGLENFPKAKAASIEITSLPVRSDELIDAPLMENLDEDTLETVQLVAYSSPSSNSSDFAKGQVDSDNRNLEPASDQVSIEAKPSSKVSKKSKIKKRDLKQGSGSDMKLIPPMPPINNADKADPFKDAGIEIKRPVMMNVLH